MPGNRGRPSGPTADTEQLVLQAAFALLSAEGPTALTPVRIHKATGVARSTVYRHWPTSGDIVDAIMRYATARHELDDLTGDVHHDLPIAVETLLFRFENRPVRSFYRATLEHDDIDATDIDATGTEAEACDDASRAPTRSQAYIAGLVEPVRAVLEHAIDSGQLRGDVDELTSQICGPLLLDHVMLGQPVDRAAVERRLTAFLATATSPDTP